jgi:ribonuclease J
MPGSGLSARIHRGSHEVGGSCVELAAAGERLIVDFGLPLDAELGDATAPSIEGVTAPGKTPVALLLSHGHPDHFGLVAQADSGVPVYIGEAAHRVLSEAAFFTPSEYSVAPTGFLRDRETIRLGPFAVTPFLVDHSAFDAYALLIEAEGHRLFYSGDWRAHGRKRRTVERLIADPPDDIDTLLLEGTRVGREDAGAPSMTEADVEAECIALARDADGMLLVAYSAQNIDRLVTLYRAALQSDRDLVIDLYTAGIAAATGRSTIPQAGWNRVRVFVPQSQRIRVKQAEAFERVRGVRASRIYPEDLAAVASRTVMTFRGSMTADLERAHCLTGAHAVWSMWAGYLDTDSGRRLTAWLVDHGIPLTLCHASGHATVEDLQRLGAAMGATSVVPIHTDAPERFEGLFANVTRHPDGEWWAV